MWGFIPRDERSFSSDLYRALAALLRQGGERKSERKDDDPVELTAGSDRPF